jgi:hypothetical protein
MAAKLLVRRIARTLFVAVRRFRSPGRLIHGHVADSARFFAAAKGCFCSSEPISMVREIRSVKPSAQPTLVRTQHLPLL